MTEGARATQIWQPARAGIAILGIAGLLWACLTLPVLNRDTEFAAISRQIILGDEYRPPAMSLIEAAVDRKGELTPIAKTLAAILRLRQVQTAIAEAEQTAIDRSFDALVVALHGALASTPEDGFLWLILARVTASRSGYGDLAAKYLRMSYAVAPSEGWVAVRRNRINMAMFAGLPEDIQRTVVMEFWRLVNSGFTKDCMNIVLQSDPVIRQRILEEARVSTEPGVLALAKALRDNGVGSWAEPSEPRPWQ